MYAPDEYMTDFGAPTGPVAFGGRGEFDGVMLGPFRSPRVEDDHRSRVDAVDGTPVGVTPMPGLAVMPGNLDARSSTERASSQAPPAASAAATARAMYGKPT